MSKMNRTKQTIENNKQCDSCLHSMIADNAVIAVAYLLCSFLSCWCIFSWFLDPVYLSSSHRLTNWLTYSHRFHLILTLAHTHTYSMYFLHKLVGCVRARSLALIRTITQTCTKRERAFVLALFRAVKLITFIVRIWIACLPFIQSSWKVYGLMNGKWAAKLRCVKIPKTTWLD